MFSQPRLILPAGFAISALAACIAAGCSSTSDDSDRSSGAMVKPEPQADPDASALAPRRVCPSERNADGSWKVVEGIDVSDYRFTDWAKVAAANPNQKFGFARISAGLVRIDARFKNDWPEMKQHGFIRGVYQYFKPSQSATAQADLYLRRLREEGGLELTDFAPVIDIETTNDMPQATVVCRVKKWLTQVERETKRVPIIYSSLQWNAILPREFGRYPLWVANYVGTPSVTCPQMPDTWPKWAMWQWSEKEKVVGVYDNADRDADGGIIARNDAGVPILAGVDMNYFDGNLEKLKAFIADSVSDGNVPEAPSLENPPVVPGASPDAGGPVDCSDGCCRPG